MLDDPVPRVVAHAGAAITNFVEGMTDLEIEPYLNKLLTKCFSIL